MKKKFNIGDKVRILKATDGNKTIVGKVGTIINTNDYIAGFVGVEFSTKISEGHTCNGKGKNGYCWHCDIGTFELVTSISPDRIIFRDNATILIKDGKRYVAKCCDGDTYDREKGLLVCLAKAHGYTFNDLQEMLKGAEMQGNAAPQSKVEEYIVLENYKPSTYPYNVPKETIEKALRIIDSNGIGFDTEDEVKEFYELIKAEYNVKYFDNDFKCKTRYFGYGNNFCAWDSCPFETYKYKQLKAKILELLGE